MKTTLAVSLITLSLLSMSAVAKPKKDKNDKAHEVEKSPPPVPVAAAQLPSERVSQFVAARLESLLAPLDKGRTAVQRRTQLAQFDQQLRNEASQSPPEKQGIYQKALVVTAALSTIMDEREKRVSSYESAHKNAAISSLANLTAGDRGKHAKDQHQKAKQDANATKNSFIGGEEKQWTDTCSGYRQQIQNLIEQVRVEERRVSAQKE